MSEEDPGTPYDPVPKLTIGQRILTSLPNLERRQAPRGTLRRTPVTAGSQATATSDEEDGDEQGEQLGNQPAGRSAEPIEPDSVISSDGREVRATSRQSSLREAFLKPAPGTQRPQKVDPMKDMTKEELEHSIKRLDDRERSYAMWAGPLGALVGIVLTIAAIHYNPPVHHKGHVANSVTELYGAARVVLGAVVFAFAYTRRRSLVAFSLLFLGTAEGFPFALLFWGLGGWMIWRVFRFQKALTAMGGGPQRARATQSPRAAARAGALEARERSRTRTAGTRERRRGKKEPQPTGPAASKRYTPPRPARPRPKAPS